MPSFKRMQFKFKHSLNLLFVGVLFCSYSTNAQAPLDVRVALVIGNAAYAGTAALTNPVNDATDIAQVLRKLGFDVVEGVDLDKRGMEDKVREFGRKLDRAELSDLDWIPFAIGVLGLLTLRVAAIGRKNAR